MGQGWNKNQNKQNQVSTVNKVIFKAQDLLQQNSYQYIVGYLHFKYMLNEFAAS